MTRVAINGFGRIGKYLTKVILERKGIVLVAINDLAAPSVQGHLFKYDSVHGRYAGTVTWDDHHLVIDGKTINYSTVAEGRKLRWKESGIDIVIECTGALTTIEEASVHLEQGAGKVIISAPSPSDSVKTILVGINDQTLTSNDRIVSNASCTTNSAGPMIKILDDHFGIESAYITTVHSFTGDQNLHDGPHRDLRRARAATQSIIPTTTGAAKAITRIFPHLEGRIGGCGIRVPVPDGSLTDISCVVKKESSAAEINALFAKYAGGKMSDILEYTDDPIVSHDIIGNSHSCIYDSQLTSVIGNMVKVVGWYDNETGYAHRLADLIELMS